MRRPKVPEREVQRAIVQGLRLLGYIVFQTSNRGVQAVCPTCKSPFKAYGGYGADPGVPDLIVSRPGWSGAWLGMEVKSETGRLQPEQRLLAERAMVTVVRSWEEAKEAVERFGGVHGQ